MTVSQFAKLPRSEFSGLTLYLTPLDVRALAIALDLFNGTTSEISMPEADRLQLLGVRRLVHEGIESWRSL